MSPRQTISSVKRIFSSFPKNPRFVSFLRTFPGSNCLKIFCRTQPRQFGLLRHRFRLQREITAAPAADLNSPRKGRTEPIELWKRHRRELCHNCHDYHICRMRFCRCQKKNRLCSDKGEPVKFLSPPSDKIPVFLVEQLSHFFQKVNESVENSRDRSRIRQQQQTNEKYKNYTF